MQLPNFHIQKKNTLAWCCCDNVLSLHSFGMNWLSPCEREQGSGRGGILLTEGSWHPINLEAFFYLLAPPSVSCICASGLAKGVPRVAQLCFWIVWSDACNVLSSSLELRHLASVAHLIFLSRLVLFLQVKRTLWRMPWRSCFLWLLFGFQRNCLRA